MKHQADIVRLFLSAIMVQLARYTMVPDFGGTVIGGGLAWTLYVVATVVVIAIAIHTGAEARRIDTTWKAIVMTIFAFGMTFPARATMVPGLEPAWIGVLLCFVCFTLFGTVRFNVS